MASGFFYREFADRVVEMLSSSRDFNIAVGGIVFSTFAGTSVTDKAPAVYDALVKAVGGTAGLRGCCVSIAHNTLEVSDSSALSSTFSTVSLQVRASGKSITSLGSEFYAYVFIGGSWSLDDTMVSGDGAVALCVLPISGLDASTEVFNINLNIGTALGLQ